MDVMKNKYIVYIDSEFIDKIANRSGTMLTQEEASVRRNKILKSIVMEVNSFFKGDALSDVLFAATFVGSDGKRHRAIEIKPVSGFGKHAGRVLKKIKKLSK